MIDEKITQKQAEIDNKLSLLTASQIIENESDAVQLHRQGDLSIRKLRRILGLFSQ